MSADTLRFPRGRVGLWVRWAFWLWGITLLVLCVRLFFWPGLHNTFLIFAQAAQNWRAGTGLYGPVAPGLDVFRYSPLVAGLLVPLGMLPISLASVLWVLANAAVFLTALVWWLRVVPGSQERVSYAILTLLALPLAIAPLHNGQSNALVIGLVLAGVAATARERWNLAAAFIALATLLKIYPLVIGLLLAVLYPRRFGGRLAIALGLGWLLPFFLQQPDYVFRQYAEWLAYLQGDDRTLLPLTLWLRDFRLLCRVWLVTPPPALYLLIQALTGLAVAGLCLGAAWRRWPRAEILTLLTGLGCTWMTVFGPSTEPCTFILLAPSLGLALVEAWSGTCPLWRRGLLAAIFGLLMLGYVFKWFAATRHLCDLGMQPFAGLLFYLLLAGVASVRIIRRPLPLPAKELPRAA